MNEEEVETMPIRGLSESRRLVRISKIHLGIKVPKCYRCQKCRAELSAQAGAPGRCRCGGDMKLVEYPRAVDYFVLPHEEGHPEKLTAVGEQIAGVYGRQPRELDVVFPVEDREQIFPQWWKCYRSGTSLWCKGDGTTAARLSEKPGEMLEIECPGKDCEFVKAKKCAARANLMVVLPRISLGGVFQIDTGSVNGIIDVNSGIDALKTLTGRISLVPCKLRLVPRAAAPDGKRKTIYALTLTPATFEEMRVLARELGELRRELANGLSLPEPAAETYHIPASTLGQLPAGTDNAEEAEDVEVTVEPPTSQPADPVPPVSGPKDVPGQQALPGFYPGDKHGTVELVDESTGEIIEVPASPPARPVNANGASRVISAARKAPAAKPAAPAQKEESWPANTTAPKAPAPPADGVDF